MIDFSQKFQKETGDQVLSPEEMKQNLGTAADSLQSSYRDLNTKKIGSSQKIEKTRVETLNKLFDMLEKYGIDPSDQEQLSAFVEELKNINPDVYAYFQRAIQDLLNGEEDPSQTTPPTDNQETILPTEGTPPVPETNSLAPEMNPPMTETPPKIGQGTRDALQSALQSRG